ncbi:hypothetical protein PVMG_00014 [Plasmodium vivax Mauritania I]|uniref:CYIR protein n=2 Tax=Plasmodium vivax TaxID=5855 RepID=A0A0J9T6P4_PLAVI|nr:hypothetical protein PVBG_05596 [Plasmodium vivax Brazil I]KMZ91140.1 hypothetical protein PVMG_00014 [Plasmodium vivax Mauritania I]
MIQFFMYYYKKDISFLTVQLLIIESIIGLGSNLSFRDELYSEILYKTLHNLKQLDDYVDVCSPLGHLQSGNNIKKICARVLKYLETVYKETYKQGHAYDVCLLLNYWVYSRLFSILPHKDENYINQVYGQLQPIWTGFLEDKHYQNLCEPINEMVSHKDWRERKELYEYCVNYSAIKRIVDILEYRCDEFHVYVENKARLYEHFERLCPNPDTNKCPEFYKDCIKYNPKNVLPDLKCHTKIKQERAAAQSSALQLTNGLLGSEPNSEEGDGRMMPSDPPNLSGKSQAVENVGNILLGVVATTMTSGALYRVNINLLIQINCKSC